MLHLIFIYLTPGEGQPAAYTLPPIFDSRENSSGGPLSAPSTIRVRQADLPSAALCLNLRCPTASFTASGTGYNPLPVRFRQADLDRDALIAINVDAPSLPPAVR